jgi:Transglycosylase-like domain
VPVENHRPESRSPSAARTTTPHEGIGDLTRAFAISVLGLYLLLVTVAAAAKAGHRWPDPPAGWLSSSLVRCVVYRESRGLVHIPGGKWQFERSTWHALGGTTSDAGAASEAEQDYRAWRLWQQVGCGAWCPFDGC